MKNQIKNVFFIIVFNIVFTSLSDNTMYAQSVETNIKFTSNTNTEGRLDGIQKYYHKNGKIFAEYEYVYGLLFNVKTLKTKKGKNLEVGTFKDGWGVLNVYDKKGNLIKKSKYMTCMLNGTEYIYNKGNVVDSVFYHNNVRVPFPTTN
jgi:antitoxin component YwqK of YwqJK toxin-antitoxin module